MTYRFSNVGEKSNTQRLYEWIETFGIGHRFSMIDVPDGVCETKGHITSSLAGLEKQGTLRVVAKIGYTDPKGSYRYTKVYEYIKTHDAHFNKRPKIRTYDRVKNRKHKSKDWKNLPEDPKSLAPPFRISRTVKRKLDQSLPDLVGMLLDITTQVEALVKENEQLRKIINEKV